MVLGMLSGYVSSAGDSLWYVSLNKPTFNPPKWVFGPVWSILYIMIGIALGKIWQLKNKTLLNIFILQLIFNLIWSPLFFLLQRIDLALYDLVCLWTTVLTFILCIKSQKILYILFIPYFLWVTFALILNLNLYILN
jgi:tryptophan-rich sensory protein